MSANATVDAEKGSHLAASEEGTSVHAAKGEPNGTVGTEGKTGGPPQGIPPEDVRPAGQTVAIMAALCLAVFLAALDLTIVATALPTISQKFEMSEADYSWIGASYTLAGAASAPTWGKLSDIWGRKPILMTANVLFFIGSLISGLATGPDMLIAGRTIQGIGGGGLIILVNICISDLFSMRSRGKYFGMIGGVWAVASALGPIVGGALTERVSWRWCFFVNLPTIGITFPVLLFVLKIHTPHTPVLAGLRAIDWLGTVLVIGGTTMFLLGLQFGGVSFPWGSATVVCLLVFGVVTVGVFFVVEAKMAVWPVIPLTIFSYRSNLAALGVCFCHGFVFISAAYFLPLYFQTVLGQKPIMSGVYLFPFILSMSFTSVGTGIWIKKTGRYREPIWFGLFMQTLGFGLFIALPATTSWPRLILFQLIAGLGTGPNFQAPLIALQSLVKGRDIAMATATFNFVRQLSTSISITIGSVVFQNQMQKRRAALISALGPQLGATIAAGSAGANIGAVASLSPAQRALVDQAYTSSFRTMWIVYVCFAFLGLLISAGITRQELSKVHEEVKTGLGARDEERRERAGKVQNGEGVRTGANTDATATPSPETNAEEKVVEGGADV